MSLNKGKAKVKAKSKSTAKSAGKNKAAVMNSRNPKKPMAISGNTMNSDSMYKKGGLVKKQGYQDGGPAISDPKLKQRSKKILGKIEKSNPMTSPYKGVPPQIKQKGGVTKKPTSPIGTGQKVDMIKQWLNKYNSKNK